MLTIRKAQDRGYVENEWLTSHHTFSFGEYYDPQQMHFYHLRVINEDYIAPTYGFPSHSHQNMEIMTYVISGELAHKDNLGNHSIIKSGEVQFMRAGTQVTHSEFNPSATTTTHLLQIWIIPDTKNLAPSYQQDFYSASDKLNKFCLLADYHGSNGAFKIAQKVSIYASILEQPSILNYSLQKNACVWIQVIRGTLKINGAILLAGDGAAIQEETQLAFTTEETTEFLLFDFNDNP